MRRRLIDFIRKVRIKRLFLRAIISLCVLILLLFSIGALLPTIASTSSGQKLIRKSLTTSLKRPVSWSNLALSWSDGLRLSGLSLGDGPPPLLRSHIDEIVILPGLGKGSDGHFGVDLTVKVRNVRADIAPGPPPARKKPAKDPLTALAEAVRAVHKLDWPLPVDCRVTIEVAPLRASYGDPGTGRRMGLEDFALRLTVPSLATRPMGADVSGRLLLDGREVRLVRLKAGLTGLVTAKGRIHPASARLEAEAGLPGCSFSASGGLSEPQGFAARGHLELHELFAAVRPFLASAPEDARGTVDLRLRARIDGSGDLLASLEADGSRLVVQDVKGKKGVIGPLDLRLRQRVVSDHLRRRVEFPDGSAAIPGLFDAAWSAAVDRPEEKSRGVEGRLGPLTLDLGRGVELAAPFLPPKTPLGELSGKAVVRRVSARLKGPGNNGEVVIEGAELKLSRLRLALAKGAFAGDGIELLLDKAALPVVAMKPAGFTAVLSWGVARAGLTGAREVDLRGARGNLQVALTDIGFVRAPSPRVTVTAEGSQALDLDQLRVGDLLAIGRLHEELGFRGRAGENGVVEASLPEMKLRLDSLRAVAGGKRLPPFPLVAVLSIAGLRLPPAGTGRPTLERADCTIEAGDFLRMTASAGLSGDAKQVATTKGEAKADLGRLAPLARQFLPSGFSADGVARAAWDLAAPLPEKAPPADRNPLRLARNYAGLLDRGEVTLGLEHVNLSAPISKGEAVISGLGATRPLRLSITRRGEAIGFEGGIEFAGVQGLPGPAGEILGQGGTLGFSGGLTQWKGLSFEDEFRTRGTAVAQKARLTVNRLDTLLEESGPLNVATLLRRLDLSLAARVDALLSGKGGQPLKGSELSGKASADLRLDLTPRRELRVRLSAGARDFSAVLDKGARVEGLNADLSVERSYMLEAREGEGWVPLSVSLVRPRPEAPRPVVSGVIADRLHEDLRGEVSAPRRITARKVSVVAGKYPVELADVEGDLLFDPESAGLGFFEAQLLGGTVRGRAMIDLKPGVPRLASSCSFSHLETARLFSRDGRGGKEEGDTEMTGEMELEAPLATEQRALLEGMRMNLSLRRFSSRIIERALFNLDPYERNEQVVAQRKMLRLGDLRWLRVGSADGALHLEGEVNVKGIAISIPKVERLRLSELPIGKDVARVTAAVEKIRGILDLAAADTLIIGPKGDISLKRRSHAE